VATDMSADELKLLSETVAKVLTGTDRAQVAATLEELGWFELWREQPAASARALFRQQGALAVSSSVLSTLMGAELAASLSGEPVDPASATPVLLPGLAAGASGGWLTGGATAVLAADALERADAVLVAAQVGGTRSVLRLPRAALARVPVDGLDPDLGLCAVTLGDALAAGETLAEGDRAEQAWSAGLALGRRLLAEELVGVVAEQQRLALEHARSREQFGRPIGAFQAVRHKLAEMHVALTSAELAVEESWLNDSPIAAALAKLLANAALELANIHCQQVLGGIGFTWEHRFHYYVRRGRVLAALLGSRAQLARELGTGLLAARELPPLAEL